MFQTYIPSGRFSPAFLVWLILGLLAMVVGGVLYAIGLQLIPLVYVNFMLTLGMGWLVGRISERAIKWGKVRNTFIGLMIAILLTLAGIGSKFGYQYYRAYQKHSNLVDQLPPKDIEAEFGRRLDDKELTAFKAVAKQNYSFLAHIKSRVKNGWSLGKVRRQKGPISNVFVYVIWAIETGTVLYISLPLAIAAARRPFAEQLDTWADESEVVMVLPITDEEMVRKIESAKTVQELLELPIPLTDQSAQHAVYTINSIPGQELEDAYVTVDLQEIFSKSDGEPEIKTKNLVSMAVITSAQRSQLIENAELMREAIQEFRASQQLISDEASEP